MLFAKIVAWDKRSAETEFLRATDPKSTGQLRTSRDEAIRSVHTESEKNSKMMNARESRELRGAEQEKLNP